MQTVSDNYIRLLQTRGVRKQHRVTIGADIYNEDRIVGMPVTTNSLFDGFEPMVGNCIAGQLTLNVIPQGDIPRMAEIKLETRLCREIDALIKTATSEGAFSPIHTSVTVPDGTIYYFTIPLHYANESEVGSVTLERQRIVFLLSADGDISGTSIAEWRKADGGLWNQEIELTFSTTPSGIVRPLTGQTAWSSYKDTEYSEWLPKGTFYIDTRKLDPETGVLSIHAFDAMLKADIELLKTMDEQSCYVVKTGGKIAYGDYRINAPDGKRYYFYIGRWNNVTGSVVSHRIFFQWSPSGGMSGYEMITSVRSDGEEFYYDKDISFYETATGTTSYIPGVSEWKSAAGENWPRNSIFVVNHISNAMGIRTDTRTHLNDEISIPYPNDWTCREILGYIAAANCGNWIVTDAGELRLVPLWSIPEDAESSYLIEEHGDAITLGGVRILV